MRHSLEDVARTETKDASRSVMNASSIGGRSLVNAHMQLAESEMRALAKQRRILERMAAQTDDARREAAIEKRSVAVRRRDELLGQLRQLRDADKLALSPDEHARRWAAVYTELASRREQLAHVLSWSPAVAGSSLPSSSSSSAAAAAATAAAARAMLLSSKVAEAAESWGSSITAVHHAIAVLADAEHTNLLPQQRQQQLPSSVLRSQLEDVLQMQVRATALLNSAQNHRHQLCDGAADLFKDQARLLGWCNEQQDTLEALSSLGDLRKFCASLESNVLVMDTNFLVLLERGNFLASNAAIREALVEVNRAWIQLSVATYRMVLQAIREEHAASGLETACKWWIDTFEPLLKRILLEARAIATHPDVAAQPLLSEIKGPVSALLKSLGSARTVVRHISDFTLREKCITPHEEALRGALLTRLSILTQTFTGDVKFDGQQEYSDRLREVADWLDANATSSTYMRLMRRVEQLRAIAEQQLRALSDGSDSVAICSS